jgi:hypothetical protein
VVRRGTYLGMICSAAEAKRYKVGGVGQGMKGVARALRGG